jgi:hypothetical protein
MSASPSPVMSPFIKKDVLPRLVAFVILHQITLARGDVRELI